ncbi:hypothetical protein [Novosphingobium aquae]|uniref:PilZ domain-containing protein n=1 Tax=Novosphingobium aquae TaxID=3133435 RepID=A0ABU8SCE8_9SPHN
MPARLRLPGGPGEPVMVTDLSEHGFRLECWGMQVSCGDSVILRPQGLESVCGTIRWIKGPKIDLAFSRPLLGPVVEHLAHQHRPEIADLRMVA